MIARTTIRRTGFTLVEILMVVAILGLTSAIIIPQMGTRDPLKTASAAREIAADLLYVQNRCVATGKYHYVIFDTTAGTYQVADAMSPLHLITHPVQHAPFTVTLGTGALTGCTFNSVGFDAQTVLAFNELGVPYSYTSSTQTLTALSAGSIVLKSGVSTMTISVLPYSGEIKVQ